MTKAEEKSIVYQLATHGLRVMGGDTILTDEERKFWNINYDFKAGYEQAEKDIIALIESRISEILGDAQPNPILRAELREIIKRIKEEEK